VSRRGAARRLLDPWAGLVLAALIALAVVTLLAAPGPWRLVGGSGAPVRLGPRAPSDVAVFVLFGSAGDRCTAVVWLHVDLERAAATVTVVPAEIRCPVDGGGYTPARRLVTDLGPGPATDALGTALGVEFAGWAVLDRVALTRLFSAAGGTGSAKGARAALKAAMAAFSAPADGAGALRRQRDALRRVVRGLPYGKFKTNAVVNYVLGSDDVEAGLDLRKATTLVEAIHGMAGGDVAVGVAAAVVETCGPASSWRLDRSRLESLRLSLALGVKAPSEPPRITYAERSPTVMVVAPAATDGGAFERDLRVALEDAGSLPVTVWVDPIAGGPAAGLFAEGVEDRRQLAVVLVPRVGDEQTPAEAADELAAMVDVLRVGDQPYVIAAQAGAAESELTEAIAASGAPVVEIEERGEGEQPVPWWGPGDLFTGDEACREAARLVAVTVARACWPAYLAPALPGTRLEFSFAARRGLDVAVAGPAAGELLRRLAACGYQATAADADWTGPAAPAVVYRPGSRRAALTVAGDLAWGSAAVIRDESAPAAVTVVPLAD